MTKEHLWFFRWRGSSTSTFPMIFAIVIVGTAFAMLFGMVRLKVVPPVPMIPRKASLIYLRDDALGRALALRAQEGGPFPSKFEPAQWEGMPSLEAEVTAMTQPAPQKHIPILRDLPEESPTLSLKLSTAAGPVFPKRVKPSPAAAEPVKMKLVPTLIPLSAKGDIDLPASLPAFSGNPAAFTANSWKFLGCLDSNGIFGECVWLEKGGDESATVLENWLRSIRFRSAPANASSRWIAYDIQFTNSPADEPDAH